jgi:hypothetical protein
MSTETNLHEVVVFILDQAEPQGLAVECLQEFCELYMNCKERPIPRDSLFRLADLALWEWDI